MAVQTADTFWARVDIRGEDECWPWTGSTNSTGYGTVGWGGKVYCAHRIAGWLVGKLKSPAAPRNRRGKGFALHSCDNTVCCNPKHLDVGTYHRNQSDAYKRKRRAQLQGAAHANAKLTGIQAEEIRLAYSTGRVRQVDLATQYCVSQRVISLVVRGESYRWI